MKAVFITLFAVVLSSAPRCKDYGCGSFDRDHACQCNSSCQKYKDCCSDYNTTCGGGGSGSCKEYGCGSFDKSHSCQCNSKCQSYGDCCSDFAATCGGGGTTVECKKAPAAPGDRRQSKNELKIVAWNVDWLFVNASHSMGKLACPGTGSNSCDWDNVTIAMDHFNHVVKEMEMLDADIISLEEVGDCDVLRNISSQLPDQNYEAYMHLGRDMFTGQNPGILTRVDPVEDIAFSTEEVNFPVDGGSCPGSAKGSHGCSKHFWAKFKLPSMSISMFGVHLLAIPDNTERCPEREAQATVVANLVKQAVQAGDQIIILGDFNDYDDSVNDSHNNVPISGVLRILREAGGNLKSVSNMIKQEERYTSWYDRNGGCTDNGGDEHSMIDHMLVSEGLYSKITDAGILHNFENGCHCLFSDHWPVWATFDLS